MRLCLMILFSAIYLNVIARSCVYKSKTWSPLFIVKPLNDNDGNMGFNNKNKKFVVNWLRFLDSNECNIKQVVVQTKIKSTESIEIDLSDKSLSKFSLSKTYQFNLFGDNTGSFLFSKYQYLHGYFQPTNLYEVACCISNIKFKSLQDSQNSDLHFWVSKLLTKTTSDLGFATRKNPLIKLFSTNIFQCLISQNFEDYKLSFPYSYTTKRSNNIFIFDTIPSLLITGSGTSGVIPKYTSSNTISNSLIADNGINLVSINGSLTLASGYNLSWGGSYGSNIPTIAAPSGSSPYLAFYPTGSTLGEVARFSSGGNLLLKSQVDNGLDVLQVNGSGSFSSGIIIPNGAFVKARRNSWSSPINVLGFESGTDDLIQVFSNSWKLRNTATGDAANMLVVSVTGDATFRGTVAASNGNLVGTDGGTNNFLSKYNGTSTLKSSLIFDNGDNIGIGTITPTEKLTINGNILAKKLIVTQSVWPDFVFLSDYKLTPLSLIEDFIKHNKHLPDMPSEKEVLEQGLDVGQTQALLLRKIEELTLYIIEQNKILNIQALEIRKLQDKKMNNKK